MAYEKPKLTDAEDVALPQTIAFAVETAAALVNVYAFELVVAYGALATELLVVVGSK